MTRAGWVVLLSAATAQAAIVVLLGWAILDGFTPEQRAQAETLAMAAGALPVLCALALLGTLAGTVHLVFTRWVRPLRGLAEGARLVALGNPRHRIGGAAGRPGELEDLAAATDLLAERYQALHEEVEVRIREANALLEEEKNTLSALMSKLAQGVLVCNPEGRILLYNPSAQRLLEGEAGTSGVGDWIGLGRSVYGVVDEGVIRHALGNVRHRLESGGTNLLVPFTAQRPGGRTLSAHLVPILDHDHRLRGYILTFVDVTRRLGDASRRGALMHKLTHGQRSAIAGIRAAIETVIAYPEMDEAGRQEFFGVIRDEVLRVSEDLDRLEAEYGGDATSRLATEDVLATDLLATVARESKESRGREIEVSAPVEPVWLAIDSFAVIRCILFLMDQVTDWCRAQDLALTVLTKRSLASLELQWSGVAVDMEALQQWGLRNVAAEGERARPLFETIEEQGGALWPEAVAANRRPGLRIVLPVGGADADEPRSRNDDDYGHDFDFHLFENRPGTRDLLSIPLGRLSVTVLDTETTGLDPDQGDEIIAIGAVRIVNGRILRRESFDTFVRPSRPISQASEAIHGITTAMLRAEPPIEDVLPRLFGFVEDTVIVGHNVQFDMRFFAAAAGRLPEPQPERRAFGDHVLDTLLLDYALNPGQEDKSLEAIAARLGLSATGRHTALGDALTTAEIYIALLPLLAQAGIRTLGDALTVCRESPYAKFTG